MQRVFFTFVDTTIIHQTLDIFKKSNWIFIVNKNQ